MNAKNLFFKIVFFILLCIGVNTNLKAQQPCTVCINMVNETGCDIYFQPYNAACEPFPAPGTPSIKIPSTFSPMCFTVSSCDGGCSPAVYFGYYQFTVGFGSEWTGAVPGCTPCQPSGLVKFTYDGSNTLTIKCP